MKLTLAELNALPVGEATRVLTECCGASAWVREMVSRRPFGSVSELLDASRKAWAATGPADWDEAFAHHPRIGESKPDADVGARAEGWSRSEQGGMVAATDEVRRQLAEGHHEYERKFGRIFIVSASGKTAEELLDHLRRRLGNTPAEERSTAAREQGKITELRLSKLLSDPNPG